MKVFIVISTQEFLGETIEAVYASETSAKRFVQELNVDGQFIDIVDKEVKE